MLTNKLGKYQYIQEGSCIWVAHVRYNSRRSGLVSQQLSFSIQHP